MLIDILLSLLAGYIFAVVLGFTCFKHNYERHGPTQHMALDLKTNRLRGWKREWLVCSRCEKVKVGDKYDER